MHSKCSTLLVSVTLFLLGLGVLQLTPAVSAAATVNWPTAVNVSNNGDGYWPVDISGNDFGSGLIEWGHYHTGGKSGYCTTVSGCAATGPCTIRCHQFHSFCNQGIYPDPPAYIYLFGLNGGGQYSPFPIYRCFLDPIITGISRIRFPLSGAVTTITGRYFQNSYGCTGDNDVFWGTRFGTTGSVTPAVSCSPTEIVASLPSWGNTGSGWRDLYLCYFTEFGGCDWPMQVSGVEYTAPVLSSVHRSTIPMTGEVVTITGSFFGTNKNFYTGAGVTTVSATVTPSSANWISTSDTQLVIRFPPSCSIGSGVQGVYLSWGGGQSTTLNSVIQYTTLPTFSSCTTNPISRTYGGSMTLTGSNLGTDCSYWQSAASGGVNTVIVSSCSNTQVTFSMPQSGQGTNADAYVYYCSGQNAVCSGCVTFAFP